MKPSEILRLAAKRMEDGINHYGASAIDDVARNFPCGRAYGYPGSRSHDYFNLTRSGIGFWGRDHEIVALCMAAAIAESEGM